MKLLLNIAASEWRYWLRSYLVVSGTAIFILLLLLTTIVTTLRMESEHHAREHQQQTSEATFLSQPDRHPHRMVHYGHYVFRSPAPLAAFDPGLDSVTGQSIFLEGHRENSAMFAQSGASADFGGLAWLSPALIYQLFAPLLILLLGYGTLTRERESKVLSAIFAQGVSGITLTIGKVLALVSFCLLLLLPMLLTYIAALKQGESFLAVLALSITYLFYFLVWSLLSVLVSSIVSKRANALAVLVSAWLFVTLIVPTLAVNFATRSVPLSGKIESDLVMLDEVRKLGDGHNSNDPAFAKLRADTLAKYGVEQIEDLPVNFRGLVAAQGEEKLTEVLNRFASERMRNEARQAASLQHYAWLSPNLAIADASRKISGTDLSHHHRFLREAETLRYDFVQGLNTAHVEHLSYEDDINRNKDEASWIRARVDADNWNVLDRFQFMPSPDIERIEKAFSSITILFLWLTILALSLVFVARRLQP